MVVVITTVLSFLGSVAGRFLTDSAIKFVAYKVFAIALLTVTFPIVVKNLVNWFMTQLVTLSTSNINTDGLHSSVITLTGLAAYLATHLLLSDCIAIIVTAMVIRLVLNFIPFIG